MKTLLWYFWTIIFTETCDGFFLRDRGLAIMKWYLWLNVGLPIHAFNLNVNGDDDKWNEDQEWDEVLDLTLFIRKSIVFPKDEFWIYHWLSLYFIIFSFCFLCFYLFVYFLCYLAKGNRSRSSFLELFSLLAWCWALAKSYSFRKPFCNRILTVPWFILCLRTGRIGRIGGYARFAFVFIILIEHILHFQRASIHWATSSCEHHRLLPQLFLDLLGVLLQHHGLCVLGCEELIQNEVLRLHRVEGHKHFDDLIVELLFFYLVARSSIILARIWFLVWIFIIIIFLKSL